MTCANLSFSTPLKLDAVTKSLILRRWTDMMKILGKCVGRHVPATQKKRMDEQDEM